MTKNDAGYERGSRAAYREMLRMALKGLGRDGPEWTAARWAVEREEVVAVMRRVCDAYGDNDWPDDLHLGDVIDKHLEPHLRVDSGAIRSK